MLLKVDLRQNDAFLFLECQLRGRVRLGGAWYYYSGLSNPMCTLVFNCMISLPDSSVFACAYMEMVQGQVEYTVAPSFLWHFAFGS